MSGGYEPNGVSKYAVYRQIRQERTYRPLGRMTGWRVALGLLLLAAVLFIAGVPSQSLAARGHFKAAKTLMLAPGWMEKYKPETKAFIEAGVLYEDGDAEAAFAAFGALDGSDAAKTMRSRSAVKLAAQRLDAGDADGAFDALTAADAELLPEAELAQWRTLGEALLAHYRGQAGAAAEDNAAQIQSLLDRHAA